MQWSELELWGRRREEKRTMKRMAIIPIFIPHKGCPNDCVFCNQKEITARQKPFEAADVQERIEEYLPTLQNRGLFVVETAFFGGSFTGIPMEEQNAYLDIAKGYKDRGLIQKIRLSTRPDYIDDEILTNLKRYGVDMIELGVQSFDEEVLCLSGRGHDAAAVWKSAEKIRYYGFDLGIQLMIGLPGDTPEKSRRSAMEAAKTGAVAARLYPTVILKNTALYEAYKRGEFHPFSQEKMISVTKDMYRILTEARIKVIRVGLKSTDLINEKEGSAAAAGTYHPAFRQLVCGEIAKEELEKQLHGLIDTDGKTVAGGAVKDIAEEGEITDGEAVDRQPGGEKDRVLFESCGGSFSNMVGNKSVNRIYFQREYPDFLIRYGRNDELREEEYRASWDRYSQRSMDRNHVRTSK